MARLLTLGLREGGISQVEVQRELQMNQPRLSKLMWKVEKARWIDGEEVEDGSPHQIDYDDRQGPG